MIERKIQILTIWGDLFLIFWGQELTDMEQIQKIFLEFFWRSGGKKEQENGW